MIETCSFCQEMHEIPEKDAEIRQKLNEIFGTPRILCKECREKGISFPNSKSP